MKVPRLLQGAALLLALTVARPAPAQQVPADAPALAPRSSWPRFGAADYVATGALLAGTAGAFVGLPQREAAWTRQNAFDDGARSWIALGSRAGRDAAVRTSDITYYVSMAYPVVVDPAAALAGDGGAELAWQMTMINAQSMAVAGLVSTLTERLAGRSRPFVAGCKRDAGYDPDCGDAAVESQSFLSGHTAMAFTGAGLVCVHHANLKLYGGAGDDIACAGALMLASTTGLTRMMADRHYLSDVLAGAAVGIGSGFVLPSLLHYGRGRATATERPAGVRVMVMPTVGEVNGLNVSGIM